MEVHNAMKTKTIRQVVNFKARAHDVYEALMDSRKHSLFTGAQAQIERKVGGKMTAYGGDIDGIILELVPDERIVQTWRSSDWPQGVYSNARFQMEKTKTGCKLTLTQTGVPAEEYSAISEGWREYYWDNMKQLLEKKQ
jgi:activator of HSP90 ATPase